MPIIRGRYYINPVLGEAIEAAREAEDALLALEQEEESSDSTSGRKAPIHHVEIEATALVPSHSGRRQRGYVARVHRQTAETGADDDNAFLQPEADRRSLRNSPPNRGGISEPETHTFSNHGDLLNFLQDEFTRGTPESS